MILQIGVKAIIKNSGNECLFLRRSNLLTTDSSETSWDIPGGRINPDENLIDALKREIKEEVGYDIYSTPELIAAQDIFVTTKDLHVVRLTYVIEENISEIHLSDEHEVYQWVSLDNIKSINAEPYLAEVLKSL
ncbi:MAG: MutT related protein [Candidatus Saccharibacteria bacterium]|nr:MutT related protein [Candidatus Saccharibacteria bacterium]